MKKFFKWLGIVVGSLLVLIILAILGLSLKGRAMLNKTYNVKVETIAIPTDAAAIEHGKHWVNAECIGCHGADLAGTFFFDAPFAKIYARNLTSGQGGAGSEFTDEDWVRALRYGLTPEGQSLIIMPALYFRNYSDTDLGDIIAYLKTVPPVDNEAPEPQSNIFGKALVGAGAFGDGFLVGQYIAENPLANPAYPPAGVTSEYGGYIVSVSGCSDCHGAALTGGKSADPSAINAPNLTPGGELQAWSEADFIKAIRTGETLSGHQLDPSQMPWEHYKNFSDDELKAIFLFLQSQPKLPTTVP